MTATARPTWLLDFDGVINILAAQGDTSVWGEWKDYRRSSPDEIPWMIWAPEVAKLVREAHDAGVRVVWLTTWLELTKTIHETITDIPEGLEFWSDGMFEKLDSCRERQDRTGRSAPRLFVPEDAPLLWTDDNLPAMLRADDRAWLRSRTPETLTISPRKDIGLTPAHVKRIRNWMANVA